MRVNLLFWIILRLRCVFRCVCARFCWQTFKYNSVHGVKVSTPECFNEHDIIAFCQCLTWIPFKHSSSFTVWLADEIITMWEKRDFGLWVTALGVLSVTQLNLHILYIPEFDTEKRNCPTRACSMSRQNRMAFPTSLKLWKTSVFSSAYSMMSLSWWWKNSRIPGKWQKGMTCSHDCKDRNA